ncbi:PAS domain S-box-containing protein [Pontibacter aydingkolensis]|uniref:histidine kinase n=1 Tax=Pontibacter aydingkolensis TaxID=1911536 RepID=A0ABS7CU49_9BACT|nr:PAS domain-containing protein [Pontibacter aydingkolensis]MBW7467388.1 PAS domain-containing protein [Pontibacter aydingkolensis]
MLTNAANPPVEVLKAFETVPDLYLIISPDLIILTASDAYLQATLTSRENIVGKLIFDAFPDNPEADGANAVKNLHASLQQVLLTKKAHRMAIQHYDVPMPKEKGGGFAFRYWLPLHTPVLNEQGEVSYIIQKVEDVTELVTSSRQIENYERIIRMQRLKKGITEKNELQEESEMELTNKLFRFLDMYRLAVDHTPDFITRWDRNLRLVFANPALEIKTGISLEHLMGKTTLEMGQPEEKAQAWMDKLQLVLATGEQKEHYNTVKTLKGERLYYTRFMPEFDEDGNVEYVLGIGRDITDLKNAELDLKASKDLLQAVFDTSRAGIAVLEADVAEDGKAADFVHRLVNKELKRMGGRDPIGTRLTKFYPDAEKTGILQAFQQVHNTGLAADFEQPCGENWFRYVVIKLEEKLVCTVEDITKRKKDELKLREAHANIEASNTTFQRMLDGSISAICLLDTVRGVEGEVIDYAFRGANKAFEELCKVSVEEVLGKGLLEVFPGVRKVFYEDYVRVIESGQPVRLERYYHEDGLDFWLDVSVIKNGDGIILTFLDVTYRKEVEKTLQKQLQVLRQSEEVVRMGSWEYDVNSGTLYWSEGMYHLLNLPKSISVSLETYLDFTVEEDKLIAKNFVNSLCTGGNISNELILRLSVSGQVLTHKITTFAIWEDGMPSKVLGVNVDISETKRLEKENLCMQLEQQKIQLLTILETQEAERKRISESLHNGVNQLLFATRLNLHEAQKHFERNSLGSIALSSAQELLNEAISATRSSAHELMPALLHDFGLKEALCNLCSNYSQSALQVHCDTTGCHDRLEPHLEIVLFRACQELINNVIKHAQASKVYILLSMKKGKVHLNVSDNGIGFSYASSKAKGLGLRNIRDRINLLNGKLTIRHRGKGKGTLVKITVSYSFSHELYTLSK